MKITNKFAALENSSDSEDINRSWENMKEDNKTRALHELKQHKPWFDEKGLDVF
jgi:hypothetical protein